MPEFLRSPAACASLVLALLGAGNLLAAGPVVNSGGFEMPFFSPGALLGQQGWTSAGVGASSADVQNTIVFEGDLALEVERVAGSSRRWALPVTGYPTGRFVTISWDMAVTVTQTPDIFGPFFGLEAYDDSGPLGLLGSLGVDATTGEVLIQEEDTGYLVVPGPIVETGVWNHFDLELDFITDEYQAYLNGELIATMGFVDRILGLDAITDADIATFAAGGDAGSLNEPGIAWFDNLIVVDGLPGDFNGNGAVDSADYTVWLDSLGKTGLQAMADGTGDGKVGFADYGIWQANFGRGSVVSGSTLGAMTLPEPSSLLLLALAWCGLLLRRRSARSL